MDEVDAFVDESERLLALLESRRILYEGAIEAARIRTAAEEKAVHLLLEALGEADAIRARTRIDRQWMARTCASVGTLSFRLEAALAARLGDPDGLHITIELRDEQVGPTPVRPAKVWEPETSGAGNAP